MRDALIFFRPGRSSRGLRLSGALTICLVSALSACSTYSRDLYQAPQAGETISVREARDPLIGIEVRQAVYTTPAFQLSAWVSASGTRRVAFGPCLLPIIPGTKEFPRSLEVTVMIAPAGSALEITPAEWPVTLGASDRFGGLEEDRVAVPYTVFSRSATDLDVMSGGDLIVNEGRVIRPTVRLSEPLRLRLLFAEYDNRFDGFVLSNLKIKSAGRAYLVPEIRFSTETRGRYTPYTTQFLDL